MADFLTESVIFKDPEELLQIHLIWIGVILTLDKGENLAAEVHVRSKPHTNRVLTKVVEKNVSSELAVPCEEDLLCHLLILHLLDTCLVLHTSVLDPFLNLTVSEHLLVHRQVVTLLTLFVQFPDHICDLLGHERVQLILLYLFAVEHLFESSLHGLVELVMCVQLFVDHVNVEHELFALLDLL